MHGEATP